MTSTARASDRRPAVIPPQPLAARHYSPRQEEVLDALEAIILVEGFSQLAIGDLAARLKCSRRTLYVLAPTKDELVMLVIDRLFQRMGKHAQQHLHGIDDPSERLRAFMFEGTSRLRRASLSFNEDVVGNAAVRRLVEDHYRYAIGLMDGLVRDGIAEGSFRPLDATLVAIMLDCVVERLNHPETLLALGLSAAEAIGEAVELIIQGMLAHSSTLTGTK